MKSKKDALTNSLSNFLLVAIYESEKLLTSFSIQQYLLYDYYHSFKGSKKEFQKRKIQQRRIKKAFYYLRRAQYITLDKNQTAKLTHKGLYRAVLIKSKQITKNKKKINDNQLYVVVFDMPERYRRLRDLFRAVLYNLGGEAVQRSVFIVKGKPVYLFLKDLLKQSEIKDYVKIITVSRLE